MANAYKTIADLTILNDQRNALRDISDVLNDAPFLRLCAADTAPDTTHYYTKQTADPAVGYRAANDGRENAKSTDVQLSVSLKILDASFAIDKAVADAYKDGPEAYVAKEAMRSLKAAMFKAERQLFYGTVSPGDASGSTGLGDEADLNSAADGQVLNAGGTSAGTGSSVWLVRCTGDNNGVAVITGKSGKIDIGETTVQRVAGATGFYPAYFTPITGWMGTQRGGTYSVVRIANLTNDAGKGLTDALIAQALSMFPSTGGPTHIVGNRRSLYQLQKSRTATNATGAPAPFPADAFGVPIVLTDSIVNTETLLA